MIVDPAVLPGLLLLAAELGVLAAVGFIVARVALRQTDDPMALAQGLVIGPALWGLVTNLVLHAVPGMAGAAVGWGVTLVVVAGLAWRERQASRPDLRVVGVFVVAALVVFWIALASRQLFGMRAELHIGLAASIRAGGIPAGTALESRDAGPLPLRWQSAGWSASAAGRARSGLRDRAV